MNKIRDLLDPPDPLTPIQRRRLEAAVSIRTSAPETVDFLHTVQCQCALPYRNPGDQVRVWDRQQGIASLRMEAGSALDPKTNKYVQLGLPYGEKPRLVLIYLASEAIRTGSTVIDVESSMTAFARSLGVATNGPQLRMLKEQLGRLSAATVRFGIPDGDRVVQVNTQIVTAMDLWFPDHPDQRILWPSTVRLSRDYFDSLSRHAVPLDRRAVAALASSSMALDIYVWLSQRLHRIPAERPQRITWHALYDQFGQGYDRVRDFRRGFMEKLIFVWSVYPTARIEESEDGLILSHSPPPVPYRHTTGLLADA